MLTDEDLKRLNWDPEIIDWADYWVNVHTKGNRTLDPACIHGSAKEIRRGLICVIRGYLNMSRRFGR
jgi:hypothetical protein